jgi:NTP pyrophosphatase (non-canonical NTP hydrolase)
MEIVGTLRNARRLLNSQDHRAPCLYGQVYGDTKGRFLDGDWITTSTIMSEEGNEFQTRFSAYKVETWAEGHAPIAANDNFTDLRAANIARQKEWDVGSKISGPLGKLWRANELSGECGEASNVVKKLVREELEIPGSRATVQQLSEELADIVICADLLAQEYGIDLDDAVRTKFNSTSEKVGLRTRLVAA